MKAHRRTSIVVVGFLMGILAADAGQAHAQLIGAHVVSGQATIATKTLSSTATATVIEQTTPNAVLNFQSYSIPVGSSVQYIGPSASAITLNRVTGGSASFIGGTLTANDRVILINNAGIVLGSGAHVTVAGLILSTADIANPVFNGSYNFNIPGQPGAGISNAGSITVTDGSAILAGQTVSNSGVIAAQGGTVVLAGVKTYTVDFVGDGLLKFAVTQGVDTVAAGMTALVQNSGTVSAPGGEVLMTAQAAKGILDNVINTSGIVEATSVANVNGTIVLMAEGGGAEVNGTLDASGKGAGETGGTVSVTGDSATLASGAKIDVSGDAGGGTALIGGDSHGQGPLPNAQTTTVAQGAVINADAITAGNGGSVVVWSGGTTTAAGTITARGGAKGGNGGNVETSGATLDIAGITVDTGAAAGVGGSWLLDPTDLTIDATAAAAIVEGLASGDVIVEVESASMSCVGSANCGTEGPGSNGDITVAANIAWNSTNALLLSAFRNITIDPRVTISDAAAGVLELRADDTGTGTGSIIFGSDALVNFSHGGLVVLTYNPLDNPAGSVVNLTSYSSTVGYTGGSPGYRGEVVLGDAAELQTYMLVNTISDFQDIANNTTASYLLSNSIDGSVTSGWNGGAGFTPIENFTGFFEGGDNTISGIFINASSDYGDIGPFAYIGSGGTVADLNLTNVSITMASSGSGSAVGGLAGANEGTIATVNVSGSVTGGTENTIGGLVGANTGAIDDSSANVTVRGVFSNYAGGLAGANTGGLILESYATGSVTSNTSAVGGLVGFNDNGTVTDAYATGAVNGGSDAVGGLIGQSLSGTISFTYAAGPLTGDADGGRFGALIGDDEDGPVISSYFATDTTGLANGFGSNFGGSGATGMTAAQLEARLPPGFSPAIWANNPSINGGLPSFQFQGGGAPGPQANAPASSNQSASEGDQSLLATTQEGAPPSSSPDDTGDANPPPQSAVPPPVTASTPLAPATGDQGQSGATSLSFAEIDQGDAIFSSISPTGASESSGPDSALETIVPWTPAPSRFPVQQATVSIGGPGSHLFTERHVVVVPGGVYGIDVPRSSSGNRALWFESSRP